jgi:S-DNA-T family DNA segregation ATPase FtsK/SpoIIIE
MGRLGAYFADLALQSLGISAYLMPVFIWLLGWKWVRSSDLRSPSIKVLGAVALWLSVASACGLLASWHPLRGDIRASGVLGMLIADYLVSAMNRTGALIATTACSVIAVYLISTFEVAMLRRWFAGPIARVQAMRNRLRAWSETRRQ